MSTGPGNDSELSDPGRGCQCSGGCFDSAAAVQAARYPNINFRDGSGLGSPGCLPLGKCCHNVHDSSAAQMLKEIIHHGPKI